MLPGNWRDILTEVDGTSSQRLAFERYYRSMTDPEILALARRSGGLIDVAKSVLESELTRRQLSLEGRAAVTQTDDKWQTLNQSSSEQKLHRALYILKYLRAMILNLIIVSAAWVLYMLVGIETGYPLADESITALNAQMNQTGSIFLVFVGLWSVGLSLVFGIWMYRSIVNVRRRALRVQSVFWAVAVFLNLIMLLRVLGFSIANLSVLFSIVAICSWVLLALVPSADTNS